MGALCSKGKGAKTAPEGGDAAAPEGEEEVDIPDNEETNKVGDPPRIPPEVFPPPALGGRCPPREETNMLSQSGRRRTR